MSKLYQLIYSDFPWKYNNRSANRITRFGGGAMAHYPVMSDDEILKFAEEKVKPLADHKCLHALWVTGPRMPLGIKVLEASGFRYATVGYVWNKLNKRSLTPVTCPGYYTSSSCEYVLFGVKGKGNRPYLKMQPQYYALPRREHSRKPNEIREALAASYPVPRIELFARERFEGWDVYGNEVSKFNESEPTSLGKGQGVNYEELRKAA